MRRFMAAASYYPGLRLGAIRGVEIRAHVSLLAIFALLLLSLGAGVFPAWHPQWGAALTWLTAFCAVVLFLASLLAHELAHALVGRAQGIAVPRITLFIFGGMAHMEREPHAWRAELVMAIVGPMVSVLIGVVAIFLGLLGVDRSRIDPEEPLALLAQAGPLATIALWLGPVNLLIALFNLVPGFPLDGGRVLRALLWWATGDIVRATRWATALGQGFGWMLVAAGLLMMLGIPVPVFGTGLVGGLWLVLIGWLLSSAAMASYTQLLARRSLEQVPVSRLMLSPVDTVAPGTRIDDLVEQHIMRSDQRVFPVLEAGRLVGLVGVDDVRRVPREARAERQVREVMTPAERLTVVAPEDDGAEALQKLSNLGTNQLPVVHGGELRGLLRREDLAKWLMLRGDSTVPA